ncbi:MAG TPA: nuclear transport factor 2 family protein [Mycobacteriales bacterium]|jgi:hypothetical protein|nr:nuclear transport factor 2 family protein [Mycobacteriales bacterium]
MTWAAACESIRQTIALYCQLLDDQRFDEVARLFTDDAVLPWEGRTLRGRTEIARELPTTQLPRGRTKHLAFGPVIDVHGTRATSWTDVVVTVNEPNGSAAIAWIGRYYDTLELVDGSWQMREHVAVAVGEPLPDGVRPVSVQVLGGHGAQ